MRMNTKHNPRELNRRPTNVTLSSTLLDEAKQLGINVSQACEQGLAAKLASTRKEIWQEENSVAIGEWNDWVDKNGLPLAQYRQF